MARFAICDAIRRATLFVARRGVVTLKSNLRSVSGRDLRRGYNAAITRPALRWCIWCMSGPSPEISDGGG